MSKWVHYKYDPSKLLSHKQFKSGCTEISNPSQANKICIASVVSFNSSNYGVVLASPSISIPFLLLIR